MNIYVYNSSTINEYSVDDCGLISSSIVETFDCGKISESSEIVEIENHHLITYCETLYPFGSINLKSTNKGLYRRVSSEFRKFENLNKKSIVLSGIILTWYGYGTLFEINQQLVRQVIPDVSGGGTKR